MIEYYNQGYQDEIDRREYITCPTGWTETQWEAYQSGVAQSYADGIEED